MLAVAPHRARRTGPSAVAARVLQQVADGAAQQLGHALHHDRRRCRPGPPGRHRHARIPRPPGRSGRTASTVPMSVSRASSRLASRISSISWSSSPMLRSDLVARCAAMGRAVHQLQAHADARQRRAQLVRGVGQQRLVAAAPASRSRSAAWLKRRARNATSSLPASSTRAAQVALAPALDAAPQVLQPLREPAHDRVGADRHRERRRCPASTGTAVLPRPHGQRRGGGASPAARGRGGNCTVTTLPSFIATWNSTPWPGTRTGRVRAWPITSPASLRMITSRGCGCWSSAIWRQQPAERRASARPRVTTTASQMRRYSGKRQGVTVRPTQSCCLANT